MQQTYRFLLKNFNIFTYYAVESVMINIVIQSKSVIIKFTLAFYLVLSLMIIKQFIINELKKLSNHILKDLKIIIFIKN